MTETYELCTRDSRALLHHQLATADFTTDFNPRPYRQSDHKGQRVWVPILCPEIGHGMKRYALRKYIVIIPCTDSI